MKKMFFYAAIATAVLTSCSKDNGLEAPFVEENETKEAIQFNLSSNFNVTTRGKGVVGGTQEEGNAWNGEKLNVYMFNKGTLVLAVDSTIETPEAYFDNFQITAPGAEEKMDTFVRGTGKYYGQNKYNVYDFFAYHSDDAVKQNNGPKPVREGEKIVAYTVPVHIDGTQDLMVAKAGLSDADKRLLEGKNRDLTRVYSAYSARAGVHPRFAFNHELSRFVFNAKAENSKAAGIVIESVEVKADTTATMTVAALDESKLGLSNWGNEAVLSLQNMTDEPLKWEEGGKNLFALGGGGSMLLAPKAKNGNEVAEYELTVKYSAANGQKAEFKSVIPAPANDKNDGEFAKGRVYTVNIVVYGFEEINLVCDLTKWELGGEVFVGGDE